MPRHSISLNFKAQTANESLIINVSYEGKLVNGYATVTDQYDETHSVVFEADPLC